MSKVFRIVEHGTSYYSRVGFLKVPDSWDDDCAHDAQSSSSRVEDWFRDLDCDDGDGDWDTEICEVRGSDLEQLLSSGARPDVLDLTQAHPDDDAVIEELRSMGEEEQPSGAVQHILNQSVAPVRIDGQTEEEFVADLKREMEEAQA